MRKKLIVFLALLILMSLYVSCAKGAQSKDGTVTLTWWQIGPQPTNLDEVVGVMNAYSKEKINVEVDLKFADWGVWGGKVSTMVNAGESWDIMFTNRGFYNVHIAQGAYRDITESVKTLTPDLYAFIPEKVWQGVDVDNKIYGVPTYKDSAQTQYWVWDKELVEKYDVNIENATTLTELDPILRKMQAGEYPKGEGYIFQISSNGINGQFSRYDQPSIFEGSAGVLFDDTTLTVVNILEQDEIMNNFKILHEWYNDGLIPVDAATTSESQNQRIPIASLQAFPGAEAGFAANRGGYEVVMTPWTETIISTSTILGSVNVISASSPYQKEALKYLELVNLDPVFRDMYAHGLEGENFEYNGDGTITKLNDIWTAPSYSQATFFTLSPISPNAPDQWTIVKEQMDTAVPSVILGFVFDTSSVEGQIVNSNAVFSRYSRDLFTGSADPTEMVPLIYAEMEKVDYNDIITEMQAQIDAWAGK